MIFHHCFAFPTWYVKVPDYLNNHFLHTIAYSAKICVPIFAFMTGWVYYHHKDKSIIYSAKKIVTFLSDYWTIVIPISLFAILFCGYHHPRLLAGEFFPLFPHPLMIHAWYVWFYILMMIIFPIFTLIESEPKKAWRILCFIAILASSMLTTRILPKLTDFWIWYPSAISGYFIARFRIFEIFLSRIKTKSIAFIGACIFFTSSLLIFRYKCYFLGQSTGYISAPLFIMGTLLLQYSYPKKLLWNALHYIGLHSMNIWFIHCIFSSPITRKIVQPAVYIWNNPLWIFCITLTISLAASIVMQPIQKYIKKYILPHLFSMLKL